MLRQTLLGVISNSIGPVFACLPQEVLQAMLYTVTHDGSDDGVEKERKLKLLDKIIKVRCQRLGQ